MSGGVEELTNRKIGDPITMAMSLGGNAPRFYGRLLGFKGESYHGEYATIVLITPSGSTVPGGLFYVRAITEPADIAKLEEYERDAVERKVPLYGGKLIKSPGGWIEAPRD